MSVLQQTNPGDSKRTQPHLEWFLLVISYLLAVIGVASIAVATFDPDKGTDLSLLNYIVNSNTASWQSIFILASLIVVFVVIAIPIDFYRSRARLIYWAVLLLLLFTLAAATAISGVSAWLRVGWGRTIQPCEF
ncbi:MAG: FtsW/RodA/SpoVE family cell cycle protein, partial [Clostridia bacterium]|nr:FtsW/RodA/SpoVE family cell cycle protein [Clostridia bacterium]